MTTPRAAISASVAGLLLAGCGGGLWLGYTWGDDGDPPVVWLVVTPDVAAPGQTVRLSAAVSDDGDGIDRVWFYRVDGDTVVRLGRDDSPPYDITMVAPSDGRTSVRVFAEAVDWSGNVGTSPAVTLTVR